ncbi:MAG: ATPase [Mesorhizobium sp.]|uniref:SRPBCC family protein n=1 Tax=Mesorhizobium sp. TaxID=1871066 RepID=UPI0011F8223E|nr:SRPBCC family protein [Mesorhizobium sp.]TIO08953.1 MAG: ATPase [Mesorhizobium sp.]
MTAIIKPAPVRKSVTVDVPVATAFDVFTSGFGRWWPASHSIGKSALRSATIEPKAGGRWFETGEDGTECDWGEVLAWEPPNRIVLAWRIRTDWQYDPSLLTEVEIKFSEAGENATRVELEHRRLENMGAAGEAAREIFESDRGWSGILQSYVQLIEKR